MAGVGGWAADAETLPTCRQHLRTQRISNVCSSSILASTCSQAFSSSDWPRAWQHIICSRTCFCSYFITLFFWHQRNTGVGLFNVETFLFAVVVIVCRVIRHNPISSFVPLNQSLCCASCSCQFWGITSICYFCCCLCTTFGRGVRGARRACVVSLFRRFKSVMSRLSIVLRIVHVFYKEIEIYCTYSHFNSLVQSQSICQGYKQGICGATDALLCCRREFRRDFILVLLWFSLLLLIFHGSMFLCGFVP
jgi:hypothetical protein